MSESPSQKPTPPQPTPINWKTIQEHTGKKFPPESFQFVQEGLSHTVSAMHSGGATSGATSADPSDESNHVDGQQLCLGLRDYAIDRYGKLARTVLRRWGITQTADFGRIVFAMIEVGLMRKTDEDSYDDFVDVYDFDEAFDSLQKS